MGIWAFVRKTCVICVVALYPVITWFQSRIDFWRWKRILYWPYAVRSSSIRAKKIVGVPWGTWNGSFRKKNERKWIPPKETPDHYYWHFWRPVVVGGTFSPSAPVLSPEQKTLAMSPSSTVHGGQSDTKYIAFEFLLRHSWLTQFRVFCLNQPVLRITTTMPASPKKLGVRNSAQRRAIRYLTPTWHQCVPHYNDRSYIDISSKRTLYSGTQW